MKHEKDDPYKTPTKSLFRWPYKLKKNLKAFLASETGLSALIACLSVVVITFILSSRYLTLGNLIQSDISAKNIVAERLLRVEDTEETQRVRYEARQSVAPIYKKQGYAGKVMMERLVNLLEDIENIRNNAVLGEAEKISELSHVLHGEGTAQSNATARVLLTTPRWPELYRAATKATEELTTRGIAWDAYRMKKEALIDQAIGVNSLLSSAEREAVVLVVGLKLRPTLLIDEKSTEEARDIAASHVRPVMETFRKGETVVRKGERITDLQRAALRQQGSFLDQNGWLAILGVAILTGSLLSTVWGYLYQFEHSTFFKPAYAGLLATMMIASVGGLSLLLDLQPSIAIEIFPAAILSLMVCIFTHPRIALLTTLILLLLCGLAMRIPLESLSVLAISSMVGIFALARKPVPKDRNDLILAGLWVGVSRGILLLAISFIYEPVLGMEQFSLLNRIGLGVLTGLFSGILTLGALPIVESWFKLVTPYTLLELANHDRPILRRMQMEAPGTFHHSIMVATLSESAAEAIGANPILTRVGALYHDIGKTKRPLFFVENQAYFGVENPHDKLTPRLSKMVITAHPRDGIEMAKQLGLPKVIMRFMPEHHGTLVAGYFYNQAVLQEGEENVNKAQFRYPGPKPQSRETAIVMMADACESAVRALKNPTVTQVEERVDKIIKQRIDDGQFNECPITLQEIQAVRETFVRILRGIQHNRIEYQQNVLEELSKKPALEGFKQMSQSLKTVQESIVTQTAPAVTTFVVSEGKSSSTETLSPPEDTGTGCC